MCAITDAVRDAVTEKTGQEEVFSAFDITKAVRASEGGHFATHDVLKAKVHAMFAQGLMPFSYGKTLIGLDAGGQTVQAFVYHPDNKTAYDHPLAAKQTVQVTVPDDGLDDSIPAPVFDTDSSTDSDDADDADDSNSGIVVTTTAENRIEIPGAVLAQVSVRADGKFVIRASNGKIRRRKPNVLSGRVRVGTHWFDGSDKYSVSVDIAENEIKISPA